MMMVVVRILYLISDQKNKSRSLSNGLTFRLNRNPGGNTSVLLQMMKRTILIAAWGLLSVSVIPAPVVNAVVDHTATVWDEPAANERRSLASNAFVTVFDKTKYLNFVFIQSFSWLEVYIFICIIKTGYAETLNSEMN